MDGRPVSDAVRFGALGVLQDRAVGNRFDQPEAEQRRAFSLGHDIGLRRDHLLRRRIDGEVLHERAAELDHRIEVTVRDAAEACLEDNASAPGSRIGMARDA
jgi:hypothetical protein